MTFTPIPEDKALAILAAARAYAAADACKPLSDAWRAAYAAYEVMADATLTASERHAVEQGFIAGHGAGMEFLRSRGSGTA